MKPEDLRVLTVRQPHASAIVLGHKDVENRSRRFPLPFDTMIAIHAGKAPSPIELAVPIELPDELPTGVIIGTVRVVACVWDEARIEARRLSYTLTWSPWAIPGYWHWLLEGARPLPTPVPCKGRIALVHAPVDVARAVLNQL